MSDKPIEIKPGVIYEAEEKKFIGSAPVRLELEVLPDNEVPVKGWFIGEVISVCGNTYQKLLNKYLKRKRLNSENDLTQEEIEKLYEKARFK